jgi:hypothetical protein
LIRHGEGKKEGRTKEEGHTSSKIMNPAVNTSKPNKTDLEIYDNKNEIIYLSAHSTKGRLTVSAMKNVWECVSMIC